MTQLGFWKQAQSDPDRVRLIDPEHRELTAGQLLARSNQLVHLLRELGLRRGDCVASLLPNSSDAIALLLATGQAGLYIAPMNYHLTGPEVAYILSDSESKAFIADERFADVARAAVEELDGAAAEAALLGRGKVDGFTPLDDALADRPTEMPEDRAAGGMMHYTSGTTGQPKGVKRPLPDLDPDTQAELSSFLIMLFGMEAGEGVHLVTAPLYHTAVTNFAMATLHGGHDLVLMDKWTPEGTLERIERHKVTNTHMVPTMFHRLLRLPDEERERYDVSSMTHAIHSAAPCPVPTKHAMLEWWGPVIYEYYAATEGGGTLATPEDWLRKPGTVGNPWPISQVKILDDDGNELPPGEVGTVWMKMGEHTFEYHKDSEKTSKTWRDGFFTVGDAGYVDEDGFLFLSDRKVDMIISGGVNIYPAETEAVLIQHAKVADVAVFGVPHEDWGEAVKAAVEPIDPAEAGEELAEELIAYCRERLAKYKCPASIDFVEDFPRDPNGKVYKRKLRDPYWEGREAKI